MLGLVRDLDRNLGFLFTAALAVTVFVLGSLVWALSAQGGPVRNWVHNHRPGALIPKSEPAPQFVVPQQMPARPSFAPYQVFPAYPGACPNGVCPVPQAPKTQPKSKFLD